MMITERCACEAEFTYDDNNPANTMVPSTLQVLLNDFRMNHACSKRSPSPSPF
jgi:hypothetical protein